MQPVKQKMDLSSRERSPTDDRPSIPLRPTSKPLFSLAAWDPGI
ncbi:MAG: hypothetical protein ACO331_02800 [Prochlorothrix sp.]